MRAPIDARSYQADHLTDVGVELLLRRRWSRQGLRSGGHRAITFRTNETRVATRYHHQNSVRLARPENVVYFFQNRCAP